MIAHQMFDKKPKQENVAECVESEGTEVLANGCKEGKVNLSLDLSIIKALTEACGCKEPHIKKQYKELGDLGLVTKASRSSQSLIRKPEVLTVTKVFNTFQLIAKEFDKDSQKKKKNHIKTLLVAATDFEPLYMIRVLQTKLRIGLAEEKLLAALGRAAYYSEKRFKAPANIDSPLQRLLCLLSLVSANTIDC